MLNMGLSAYRWSDDVRRVAGNNSSEEPKTVLSGMPRERPMSSIDCSRLNVMMMPYDLNYPNQYKN